MSLVALKHVRYRYSGSTTHALDDINLSIDSGEFVLLAGASGSGKSTLCRLLNGLIPHFHAGEFLGAVRVDDLDTREHTVSELYAHVGLVFQNPEAQLFNSTVEREIAFGLESLGLPSDEIRARVEWALAATQLTLLKDRSPHSLSGGEQQIVALASMLVLRPRVLVLDEPFANLDPESIARILMILRDVHKRGTTLVLTEHRLHSVIQDATRLVILDHGHIVRDGAPREVLREDVSRFHLNAPFVVRLAAESHWRDVPLSVEEALMIARKHEPASLFARRNGSVGIQANAPPVVEMHNVAFSLDGSEILRNVNLEIHRGECIALVGKNGSGKTTLLKHLNALYRPSRGTVVIFNRDTRTLKTWQLAPDVAFVFQNPNDQLFKSNVREEIEVAPRALDRVDDEWLGKLYDLFGLDSFLDRSPFTLSEGEKKRVAFAAALAARPQIVLLDEPTTGQDFSFRAALAQLLLELQRDGITILFSTHDLSLAEQLSSRWVVLSDGELVADGKPDEVMGDMQIMRRASLRPTARWQIQTALEVQLPFNLADFTSDTRKG